MNIDLESCSNVSITTLNVWQDCYQTQILNISYSYHSILQLLRRKKSHLTENIVLEVLIVQQELGLSLPLLSQFYGKLILIEQNSQHQGKKVDDLQFPSFKTGM